MKNQLVNFVNENFEAIKIFFYNQEKDLINYECDGDIDLLEFLDEQMNVSTSIELIEVINERSLGVDLEDDSDCEELFDMIKLFIEVEE
jgi:hypothetical protein